MEQNGKSRPPPDPQPPSRRDPSRKGLILVAEVDPDIAKMLRIYLESLGYEVLLAKQGREVLETCLQDIPDVVILATGLPDMSGAEVHKELRSNPKTKRIPIVFILEENEGQSPLAGVDLEAKDELVTKPFDIEKIKRYIERVVPRNPRAPGTVLWQSDEG